jgi:hypothetical protein
MVSSCASTPEVPTISPVLTAAPIPIRWDPSLPVFAKEEFLRAAGDEYGWLGGMNESGALRCILPYTVIRKTALRMVRFRMETISCGVDLATSEEKSFLNSVVQYFRTAGADVIIPPSNNALFRTYPDGASAAPYGSYIVDLQQSEEALWKNISKTSRQNITSAQKEDFVVREAVELLDPAYDLIRETFSRSKMGFMSRDSFQRFARSLGPNGKLLVAERQGIAHSYGLFAFSAPSAYWMYGGNIAGQHPGAMKLLQWEAIRLFRSLGVRQHDFFGARVDPPKGSKQEGINRMKKHLGGSLSQGYVWKYSLRPSRAWLYSKAVRVLRGGDLVDQEEHKMRDYAVVGS